MSRLVIAGEAFDRSAAVLAALAGLGIPAGERVGKGKEC